MKEITIQIKIYEDEKLESVKNNHNRINLKSFDAEITCGWESASQMLNYCSGRKIPRHHAFVQAMASCHRCQIAATESITRSVRVHNRVPLNWPHVKVLDLSVVGNNDWLLSASDHHCPLAIGIHLITVINFNSNNFALPFPGRTFSEQSHPNLLPSIHLLWHRLSLLVHFRRGCPHKAGLHSAGPRSQSKCIRR